MLIPCLSQISFTADSTSFFSFSQSVFTSVVTRLITFADSRICSSFSFFNNFAFRKFRICPYNLLKEMSQITFLTAEAKSTGSSSFSKDGNWINNSSETAKIGRTSLWNLKAFAKTNDCSCDRSQTRWNVSSLDWYLCRPIALANSLAKITSLRREQTLVAFAILSFRSYVGFMKLTFFYKSRAGAPEMYHLQGRGKAKRKLEKWKQKSFETR